MSWLIEFQTASGVTAEQLSIVIRTVSAICVLAWAAWIGKGCLASINTHEFHETDLFVRILWLLLLVTLFLVVLLN